LKYFENDKNYKEDYLKVFQDLKYENVSYHKIEIIKSCLYLVNELWPSFE